VNAHLAEAVARLSHFECGGVAFHVEMSHMLRASSGRRYAYDLHRHGHLELTFVLEGCVRYATPSEAIPVAEGHVFVMPPGMLHRWEVRDQTAVFFGFMLELLDPGDRRPLQEMENAARVSHHCLAMVPPMEKTCDLLVDLASQRSFRSDLAAPLMEALLTMTYCQLMRSLRPEEQRSNAEKRQADIFEKARVFIEANLDHSMGVDEIADYAGIGARQLNRVFRAGDGRSVMAFVHECRLERARAMLKEGHSSKETAYACGFKDPAYFTRFFKRYTGHTPSEYA